MRMLAVTTSLLLGALGGCTTEPSSDPSVPMPEIVTKAIEFHGGDVYDHSAISITITSLSGSFGIETRRTGGNFEHTVTGHAAPDGVERRVELTNDAVREWRDGLETELDDEGARRARAFVDARVFFPLLPFTLEGGDVQFDDRGIENWHGVDLHKVKITFTSGTSNDADDSYMFWFDPNTGRVEQFGYDFSGGLRFRKAAEFNRVGGILFSDQKNYAINGARIPVDRLSPDYVDENMSLLSTVVISDISVDPL